MATIPMTAALRSKDDPYNKRSGTLSIISQTETTEVYFKLMTDSRGELMSALKITPSRVVLYLRQGDSIQPRLELSDPHALLELQRTAKYWVSLDAKSGILRYGKYFPTRQLTLLTVFLKPQAAATQQNAHMLWDGVDSELDISQAYGILKAGTAGTRVTPIYNPLTVQCDPKPYITPANCLDMRMIASGEYTVPSSLHPACQELYDHISGPGVSLGDEDFPDFAAAIQHSIETNNGVIWTMLRKKAVRAAHNREASDADMAAVTDAELHAQYLRITLGCHKGNSPGVPFVLEIWPGGHHSAIHDHDGACAMIKVLHGEIKCQWYKSLKPPREMDEEATFKKNQITWMDPDHFQIHRLRNRTSEVCCTLQSYQYPHDVRTGIESDGTFHYLNRNGTVTRFEPNSDTEYEDFRKQIKDEWIEYHGGSIIHRDQ